MTHKAPIFWITRPAEDSAHTAASIAALGAEAIVSPVMHIEPVAHEAIAPVAHAIITSKYASAALANLPRNCVIWCVGEKLAARMRAMGFESVHGYTKAQLLLQAFAANVKPPSDVVYVRGETVRMDITAILRAQHYRICEVTCYRTVAETTLSPALLKVLKHPERVQVLLYAKQAARYTQAALASAGLAPLISQMHACCISADVAESAARTGFVHIHTSMRPDGTGMLMLAGDQIAASLST